MPECTSYKTNGVKCHANAQLGDYCRTHHNSHNHRIVAIGILAENQCEGLVGRQRCPHQKVEGISICAEHVEKYRILRAREAERQLIIRNRRDLIDGIVQGYVNTVPVLDWQTVVIRIFGRYRRAEFDYAAAINSSERYFIFTAGNIVTYASFENLWTWLRTGVGERPVAVLIADEVRAPPPVQGLAAFVRDPQNVHTIAVSTQTNEATAKLLAIGTGQNPRAIDWLAAKWLVRSYGNWKNVKLVVDDMYDWYNRQTCRKLNDWLYRRVLNGLYFHIISIEDNELKTELWKRVFEECSEARGLCCEGHISRLCNVLVGFDESFKPPVPVGELLQQKMAVIAGKDTPVEEKMVEARALFEELNIPEVDRVPWIEAIESM